MRHDTHGVKRCQAPLIEPYGPHCLPLASICLSDIFAPLPFHLPDLPGPWVGGVQGIPIMLHTIAFWEDFRTNGVHKGIDIDGYEVILLDEDTLDLLDQALPFG